MKKINYFLAVVLLAFLASSCSQRLIDFTVISSKNVSVKVPETAMAKRIAGEDFVFTVLGFPLGVPNLKQATDKAIESAGPGYDALVDGVVFSQRKWYLLFGKIGYRVEGTPIKTSQIRN